MDARHSMPCSPVPGHDAVLERRRKSGLIEAPWLLGTAARTLTVDAMVRVCAFRGWTAHAIHARTTHIHAVIAGNDKPERMAQDFKAYATRALQRELARRRYWADHGSTRYLWNTTSVNAAVEYVLHGQGARMASYRAADTSSDQFGRS